MDDFNLTSLHESRNEWAARLIALLTPPIIDSYRKLLKEAVHLCTKNGEPLEYLKTFQNFLSKIPQWNSSMIESERKRICEQTNCTYLEDLITCVHIVQMKALTAMRVGHKQKKIHIDIPKLDDFIHKVYINTARSIYRNVYLFQRQIPALQTQRNQRDLDLLVQECIMTTIRDSVPVEEILKAYLPSEETYEDEEEQIEERIVREEPILEEVTMPGADDLGSDQDPPLSFASFSRHSNAFPPASFNHIDHESLASDAGLKLQIHEPVSRSDSPVSLHADTIADSNLEPLTEILPSDFRA